MGVVIIDQHNMAEDANAENKLQHKL